MSAKGASVAFESTKPNHAVLLERIKITPTENLIEPESLNAVVVMIERLGRGVLDALAESADLIYFLGLTVVTIGRFLLHPRRIRMTSLFSHLKRVGLNALPIVGLLAFLIGIVIAYKGIDRLRLFGAEIFAVDLLAISILREMAILLSAIIIAGRSSSSFTAQIGTMQVNQEVDAMRAMGLDPVEMLVLPRLFAVVLAMPLLAIVANLMGLAGGAIAVYLLIDVWLMQFTERIKETVPLWSFWVGLIKAPVYGFIIRLVSCQEGLKVAGSAESVGRQTTKAVVVVTFLVIVFDAIFSIFFSYIGV